MRVALNLLGLPSVRQGGAGLYSEALARGLTAAPGVDLLVLCGPQVAAELGDLDGQAELECRPQRRAPWRRVLDVAGALRDPRRFGGGYTAPPARRLEGCDLVHYPLSFMAPPVHGLPTVVTCADLQHLDLSSFFSTRDRLLRSLRWHPSLRRADRVVAMSEFTRGRLENLLGLPAERIGVVHLACHPDFFLPPPARSPEAERYLFYPASPLPAKNHERLLAAFAGALGGTAVKLVLSGPRLHDWAVVRGAVARYGLEQQVVLRDHLTLTELRAHLGHAQALVFPSLYEGFGLPVVEAMAAGCPVVAGDAGSVAEVAGGAAARLFDPSDQDALESAIEEAANLEGSSREEAIAAGRDRAAGFTVERMVETTLEEYERTLRQ